MKKLTHFTTHTVLETDFTRKFSASGLKTAPIECVRLIYYSHLRHTRIFLHFCRAICAYFHLFLRPNFVLYNCRNGVNAWWSPPKKFKCDARNWTNITQLYKRKKYFWKYIVNWSIWWNPFRVQSRLHICKNISSFVQHRY